MIEPLRVTVVAPAGVIGGSELWLLSLLDATDRLAPEVVMLADGPLRVEFTRRGIPCVVRPTGASGGAVAGAAAWLTRRLRSSRPDVVLANGVKAAVVAAPAAWLAGVRCVWAKHDHSFDGPVMTSLAALTDACVATEATLLVDSRHPRATLVPFPAPGREALPRDTARQELVRRGVRLDRDELLLVMAARLVGYKGLDDAVTALAQPGGSRWRLAVIGPEDPAAPDEHRRLAALAEDLGVADRVDFTGWVPDAWRLLPAADAVAVLTKPYGSGPEQESFGAVALEAMVSGVPVIATAPGPVADRMDGPGERAGITVSPAQPVEVADALHHMEDPTARAAMGQAGRSRATSHPSAVPCAALLAQTLSEAARLPGAGLTGTAPVSVLTCFWNEGKDVDRLLALLLPQLTVDGDELVVVDDGSTDDTADRVAVWAARDERVRLLALPHQGLSASRNAGVRAARHSLIACTDAGCDPAPDWLARLRAAWAEPDPADLLAGVYRVSGQGILDKAMALVGSPLPEEARHPGPWTRVYSRFLGRAFDAARPPGRSMAFTRAAWQGARGFREELTSAEDIAFGQSVIADGRRAVVVASAEVVWKQHPTLRKTARMYFRYGQGGGRSADPRLIARDIPRTIAYPAAAAAVRTPHGRRVAAVGAIVYLSLPAARAIRERHWAALPVIPLVVVVRDLAKAAGTVHGLATRLRTGRATVPAADTDGL